MSRRALQDLTNLFQSETNNARRRELQQQIERLQREIRRMEAQVGLVLTNIAQITPNTVNIRSCSGNRSVQILLLLFQEARMRRIQNTLDTWSFPNKKNN